MTQLLSDPLNAWADQALAEFRPPTTEQEDDLSTWGENALRTVRQVQATPELQQPPTTDDYIQNIAERTTAAFGDFMVAAPLKGIAAAQSVVSNLLADVMNSFREGDAEPTPPNLWADYVERSRGSQLEGETQTAADVDSDLAEYGWYEAGKKVSDFLDEKLPGDPRLKQSFWATQLPEATGTMAAFMLGGVVANALKIPSALAVAGMGAGAEATGQYEQAKAFGASEKDARKAAKWGFLIGTSEALPVTRILDRLDKASAGALKGGLRRVVAESAKGATEEALQEFFQTTAGNAVAQRIYDRERKLVEGVGQASGAGGILGAVASGILTGVGLRRQRRSIEKDGLRVAATEFVAEKPEAAERILQAAEREEAREEGPRGIPSEKDFAAEGLVDLTRRQREQFVEELRDARAERIDRAGREAFGGEGVQQPVEAGPEAGQAEQPQEEVRARIRKAAEEHAAPPSGAPGIASMDDMLSSVRRGGKALKAFVQRWLTTAGDFPQIVKDLDNRRKAKINRLVRQAVFTLRDFDAAAKEAYGGRSKMTPEDVLLVDAVLKKEAPLSMLPRPMQRVVPQMRSEIDALSEALIEVGAVEGALIGTIRGNLGVYVTRSYKVHTDPKWAENVPSAIRNKFKAWLREQEPGKTDEQLDGMIEHLLYEGKAAESPIGIVRRAQLGSKDLSILKYLTDMPIELRLLYGERKDARANYAISVMKISQLMENHRFLRDVREVGLGTFLFEEPIVRDGQQYKVRIKAEPWAPMAPLDGLYTTPEIKRAFDQALAPGAVPAWLMHYMRVNGVVKYAKTVGSLMTHIRNVLGNGGFATAQGHWRVWNANTAVRSTLHSLGKKNEREYRDFFLHMVELGVVDESARAGELRDVIRDSSRMDADQFLGANADKLANRITRAATELYRAEDDVWKIFAFLNEKTRYKKAHPEWSTEQVEKRAAHIVRNTYPTYSQIPAGIQALRRFPAVGTFVSFPYEVGRTSYHTLRLIREELQDPATRAIAYQRIVGVLVAASAPAAIATAFAAIAGVTWKDDQDKRQFVPPWSKHSNLLHIGEDDEGNQRYIDLSYVDPFEYMKTPVMALARDWTSDDWEKLVVQSVKEAAEPFLSEEILFGKGADVWRNKKQSGGWVYNPEEDPLTITRDIVTHIGEALVPGTAVRAKRFIKGVRGETNVYGRKYDPKLEALAEFTGQRINTINIKQSLQFRVRDLSKRFGNASSIIGSVARRQGEVSADELRRANERTEVVRASIIKDAHKVYHAAIRRGVPTATVNAEFDRVFSREAIHEIATGIPFENAWASNTLHRITSPSMDREEAQRMAERVQLLGIGAMDARELLNREYSWRNLEKGRERPRGRPSTVERGRRTAFGERVRRLRRLWRD